MAHDTDFKSLVNDSKFSHDWHVFLKLLVNMIDCDLSNREIGAYFTGHEITWFADIKKLNLTRKLVQGIDLNMGTPQVKIDNTRTLRASHVVLHFQDDVSESWYNCSEGDRVKFRACFVSNDGVRPAVSVSRFDDGISFTLKLGLDRGEMLEVVK